MPEPTDASVAESQKDEAPNTARDVLEDDHLNSQKIGEVNQEAKPKDDDALPKKENKTDAKESGESEL